MGRSVESRGLIAPEWGVPAIVLESGGRVKGWASGRVRRQQAGDARGDPLAHQIQGRVLAQFEFIERMRDEAAFDQDRRTGAQVAVDAKDLGLDPGNAARRKDADN